MSEPRVLSVQNLDLATASSLYLYPSEHYPFWNTVRAQSQVAAWGDQLAYGALGEHLTLSGLSESDLWMGDVLKLPALALIVTGPRQPDFVLNEQLGFDHAVKMMSQSGWCGFHAAVQGKGAIRPGDRITLQPGPREIRLIEWFRHQQRS